MLTSAGFQGVGVRVIIILFTHLSVKYEGADIGLDAAQRLQRH